ncbi:MAG: PDZ domain-containing protein [Streptosporangiales bacterium]|nr:PDZ domain-containing protein [Streptosporangiales bacterium]
MSDIALLGWAGILLFIVALLTSIMLHEAGHFVFAKKYGMKASEFFVGFGPRLWSFRRGETEFGIKALPLGGYVKILGMTPLEELDPAEQHRAFYKQKPWHRFMVLVAGSLTHFVIGIVILLILLMAVGIPMKEQTLELQAVSKCLPTSNASASCASDAGKTPAAKAGIKPGDKITGFNGAPVQSWDGLSKELRAHGGEKVTVTVERGGQTKELSTTLATVEDQQTGKQIGFLGVTAGERISGYQTYGPLEAVGKTGEVFVLQIGLIFKTLGQLPAAIPKLFSEERGETEGGQVGSVVGAGRMAGSLFGSDDPGRAKASNFLNMLQSINVFIGVFNLLPLLPMDGGHIAVLFWERIKAWFARKRGKLDPGPVDMTKLMPLTYAVFVLLVGLGAVLITADVVNPLESPF